MTMNPLARLHEVIMVDCDQHTKQQIAMPANKLMSIGEITRTAVEEITDTTICSGYQVAQALLAVKAIEEQLAAAGIAPEEYKLIFGMDTLAYLKTVARTVQKGNEAISDESGRR